MQDLKTIISSKIILLVSVGLLMATLSGCKQSNAATNGSETKVSLQAQNFISDNTLKVVNAAFYQKFVLGDWRYKGAVNHGGTINAYIKIPAPLEMSAEVQKTYLKQLICPSSAHANMWKEINNIPLSIHIYTKKQKNSLYVHCQNPFIASL